MALAPPIVASHSPSRYTPKSALGARPTVTLRVYRLEKDRRVRDSPHAQVRPPTCGLRNRFSTAAAGLYAIPTMHDISAAAVCPLCGREIKADQAEHYRGHLENARTYLELVQRGGGDGSWSATAHEWIERCETILADLESGTVN